MSHAKRRARLQDPTAENPRAWLQSKAGKRTLAFLAHSRTKSPISGLGRISLSDPVFVRGVLGLVVEVAGVGAEPCVAQLELGAELVHLAALKTAILDTLHTIRRP